MRYGIALGSNVGDRLRHLTVGWAALTGLHTGPERMLLSPVYETDPVDCAPGTAAYLNAVVELETGLEPAALLGHLQEIERAEGRPAQHGINEPRTLDLDLLYADDLVLDTPALILPHPRMTQRRFVLQPLADIRPGLILPGAGLSVSECLEQLPALPKVHPYQPHFTL